MKDRKPIIYFFMSICFVICVIVILSNTNFANNIQVSKAIEVIIILYLIRISYGCILFIEKQYKIKKIFL